MGKLRGFREVDARGSRSITSYFTKTEATVSSRLAEDDVAGASGGAGETRTGPAPPGGVMANKSSDEVERAGVIAGASGGAGKTMTTAAERSEESRRAKVKKRRRSPEAFIRASDCDDEHLFDADGFLDFADDRKNWPPRLHTAVEDLEAHHRLLTDLAKAGDLAHVVSTTYAHPYFSGRHLGIVGAHFPPEDAIGDRSIVTLRVAESGRWKGTLQAANPCVRLFNYLLDAATGSRRDVATSTYRAADGNEETVALSPEGVWLLCNDFIDLLPPLTCSDAGGTAMKAIKKVLGEEFCYSLLLSFSTALAERSKYLAERRGAASVGCNIILWGAGTSDGKRHGGVLHEVHLMLRQMSIHHAKIRHPEAILRRSFSAKMAAEFDDAELNLFLSNCMMEDVNGEAVSRFLGIAGMTEEDKLKLKEIMREIGRTVDKKPGKVGSEKRRLYEKIFAECPWPADTEDRLKMKQLKAAKIAQLAQQMLGLLKSAGILGENDSIEEKITKLWNTELSSVFRSVKVGNTTIDASASILALTADCCLSGASSYSSCQIYDAIAVSKTGDDDATHAQAVFDGIARLAGISSEEAKTMTHGHVLRYVLAAKAGITPTEADQLSYKGLLDAYARVVHGPSASHSTITFDAIARRAGISSDEADQMTCTQVIDLATQHKRGADITYAVAKRAGWLEAFGIERSSAEVMASVDATQHIAYRLALARSLGVDLSDGSRDTGTGLSKSEFDALSLDERRVVEVATESLDIAAVFDLTPDDAFELREAMCLRNLDANMLLSDVLAKFGDVMASMESNRPVVEFLASREEPPKLTSQLLKELTTHRHREAHLVKKSELTLQQIRQMTLENFQRHFESLDWPVYEVDVNSYISQGRWIDEKHTQFSELKVLLETRRSGLARGLPTNWCSHFAMVASQRAHQVDLRLYVKNGHVWNLAKLEENEQPKAKSGAWKNAKRYSPVSSDADKVRYIEKKFELQALEATATVVFSARQLAQETIAEWTRTNSWVDVHAAGDGGRDFIDYMENDPRAGELPVDWKERIRWHRYQNHSAADPTQHFYQDLYIDCRPVGETRSMWYGVRTPYGDGRNRCEKRPCRQIEFLKKHFFGSAFVTRPLSEQNKICELGAWDEEFIYEKELEPSRVAELQAANDWITSDEPRMRGAFRGFQTIADHLANHDSTIDDERWKKSFAFVRVQRNDRPGGWRFFMCVFHRGKWRECGVRTQAKKHEDGSLMPKQNHKMSWYDRGEFVRLWLNSSRA